MAKVICMASAKGGSGKTTIAVAFGTFLSSLGKKVLLVDTDAATNGLSLLYLKEIKLAGEISVSEGRRPKGIFESFDDSDNRIYKPEFVMLASGIHLIPATFRFRNTEDVATENFATALNALLKFSREEYDYIILDAQAGSDSYAAVSIKKAYSDEVVIVSEYDPISAAGVERLKALFPEDLNYTRTWYLLNKMLPEFVKSFSDFLEVAKYISPIPWDADVVRAYARRRTALDVENGNEYTLAIIQTLMSLLGQDIEQDIMAWMKERQAKLREPISNQIKLAEAEYDALLMKEEEQERIRKKNSIYRAYVASASLIVGICLLTVYVLRHPHQHATDFSTEIAISSGFTAISMALVGSYFLDLISRRVTPSESKHRKRREERLLELRLSKLHSLQNADLSTLIKAKKTE